jgi:hypothetical protein
LAPEVKAGVPPIGDIEILKRFNTPTSRSQFHGAPFNMPAHTILFWVTLPVLLGAILYQIGLQALLLAPIHEFSGFKTFRSLFEETHCYASVTTLSNGLPNAECFSVSNGRFSRVFKDDLIKQDSSFDAVKEARAGYVYPGLWDGHGHLIQYGELLNSVDLFGSKSVTEVQDRLVQYKAAHPEEGTSQHWIRGVGWDQAHFDGAWPLTVSTPKIHCSPSCY